MAVKNSNGVLFGIKPVVYIEGTVSWYYGFKGNLGDGNDWSAGFMKGFQHFATRNNTSSPTTAYWRSEDNEQTWAFPASTITYENGNTTSKTLFNLAYDANNVEVTTEITEDYLDKAALFLDDPTVSEDQYLNNQNFDAAVDRIDWQTYDKETPGRNVYSFEKILPLDLPVDGKTSVWVSRDDTPVNIEENFFIDKFSYSFNVYRGGDLYDSSSVILEAKSNDELIHTEIIEFNETEESVEKQLDLDLMVRKIDANEPAQAESLRDSANITLHLKLSEDADSQVDKVTSFYQSFDVKDVPQLVGDINPNGNGWVDAIGLGSDRSIEYTGTDLNEYINRVNLKQLIPDPKNQNGWSNQTPWLVRAGGGDDIILGNENTGATDPTKAAGYKLYGEKGNDIIRGNSLADFLFGGVGDDELTGGENNDYLEGGEGQDFLNGESGDDTLKGGAGDDVLIGGPGDATIEGNEGADTFYLATFNNGDEHTIKDYNTSEDSIETPDLSGEITGDLTINGDETRTFTITYRNDADEDGNYALETTTIFENVTTDKTNVLEFLFDIDAVDKDNNNGSVPSYGPETGIEGPIIDFKIESGSKADNDGVIITPATLAAAFGADFNFGTGKNPEEEIRKTPLRISGGQNADAISGGNANDTINGGDGEDTLSGGKGNDYIEGGKKPDTYILSESERDGQDTIFGYKTEDRITIPNYIAGPTPKGIDGLPTNITQEETTYQHTDGKKYDAVLLTYGEENAYQTMVVTNQKIDTIPIDPETPTLPPSGGGDSIIKPEPEKPTPDPETPDDGFDDLPGDGGESGEPGNPGDGTIDGGEIDGGEIDGDTSSTIRVKDVLKNPKDSSFDQVFKGTKKADQLVGDNDSNKFKAKEGNDMLKGKQGNDRLNGHEHNDTLVGNKGRDVLDGGKGADVLDGGRDQDVIYGGLGKDTMTGNQGRDIFILSSGKDTINDFQIGKDDIGLVHPLDLKFIQKGDDLRIKGNEGVNTLLLNVDKEVFMKDFPNNLEAVPVVEVDLM